MPKVPDLLAASVIMISRGRDLLWFQRRRQEVNPPSFSSSDSDYSPSLGQALVEQEGAFRCTRSWVAITFKYDQPSSIGGTVSPESLRHMFQWLNEEEKGSGYAFSSIISSVQKEFVLINMADNNTMISIAAWRFRSKLSGLRKRPWTTSNV